MGSILTAILTAVGPLLTFIINRILKSMDKKEQEKDKLEAQNKIGKNAFKDFTDRCLKFVTQVDIEYVQNEHESAYTNMNEEKSKEKAKELIKKSYGLDGLTQLALLFDTDAKGLERIIDLQIEAAIMSLRN